jgi:hypothetical protein
MSMAFLRCYSTIEPYIQNWYGQYANYSFFGMKNIPKKNKKSVDKTAKPLDNVYKRWILLFRRKTQISIWRNIMNKKASVLLAFLVSIPLAMAFAGGGQSAPPPPLWCY